MTSLYSPTPVLLWDCCTESWVGVGIPSISSACEACPLGWGPFSSMPMSRMAAREPELGQGGGQGKAYPH